MIDSDVEKNKDGIVNSIEELNWNTVQSKNIYKILRFVECLFRGILIQL